ncbi:MAG: lipoyl domain-containing protein, partial [Micrococcales bacterium]|nr:lipoyl domain-containing protein [Micrococcales bacterium]
MSLPVLMPAFGESISQGTLTRWLKQPGDQVAVGEALAEVSTDVFDA